MNYSSQEIVDELMISKGIINYAFQECNNLTKLKIPSSVTFIGEYSFDKCESLKEIEIPNSVSYI